MLTKNATRSSILTIVLTVISSLAFSQSAIRPFSLVYSENLKGGTTMFGNTMLHIVNNGGNPILTRMNETSDPNNGVGGLGNSQYGNDNSNMQFTDIDGVTATQNSSSADLILPAGTNTIKFARLYWGGRINNTTITSAPDTLRKIKIRKGTSGAYFNVTAASINVDQYAISTTEKSYQSFSDITAFINSNGSGTYTIADLPITPGTSGSGGKFGGWCIVVAYENTAEPYNSIRIFDGFARVYDDGSTTLLNIGLSGLNVPNVPLAANEAVMGTMAWEGDANLGSSTTNPDGDYIKINNITVSNAYNPAANFWNGSITNNGALVSTKNPNYSNQMGIDIDQVNVGVGYGIAPNATSVTVQFGTEADMYFPSIFTFMIRVKEPTLTLDKSVTDANNDGYVGSEEELTYVLSGSNSGVGSSYNTFIVDTLPSNVTYVANTLEVINVAGVTAGFKTDAQDTDQAFKGINGSKHYVKFFLGTGATGTTGGQLPAGPSGDFSVRFKVRASVIPGTIVNTARLFSSSVVGDQYTDDGTAVIGEASGPVPVKLTSFNAKWMNANAAILSWNTQFEQDNDYFEIQRSTDGIRFESRGRVAGNGTTQIAHDYQFQDGNIKSQIVYYRLRIVDMDGKYSFSKIVALRKGGSLTVDRFAVFPNPFVQDIRVSLTSQTESLGTFRILSFEGKELARRTAQVQKGDNIIVLKDLGNLPKANYILEVTCGSDKFIQKIVKN
jgi:uncharacterized repeat protein (TIGR01451 family)